MLAVLCLNCITIQIHNSNYIIVVCLSKQLKICTFANTSVPGVGVVSLNQQCWFRTCRGNSVIFGCYELLMASPSPSPALSCSEYHMFSYSSTSFSARGLCIKCTLFAALEATLSELETRLRTIETVANASQLQVVGGEQPLVALPP